MTKKTVIFGQGLCADEIKRQLSEFGCPVVMAAQRQESGSAQGSPDGGEQTSFVYDRLLACTGSAGDLTLLASVAGGVVRQTAASIILAAEGPRKPDFAAYGLSDGASVMSLSELRGMAESGEELAARLKGVKRVAFLTGISKEKTPVVCEEVMRTALLLQSSHDVLTFIFTRNLKVAAWGLEALYRETRTAGVIYVKLTQPLPEIVVDDTGAPVITCRDDISREFIRLRPDLTVVDETLAAPPLAGELAGVLQIEQDEHGFGQSDNVHRCTVATNRRGILAVGPARSALVAGKHDQMVDAANAAAVVVGSLLDKKADTEDAAEIDTGQCVRCLTCYRLCPYRAVLLRDEQPVVDPLVCERCGICAAECPALAIRLPGFEPGSVGEDIEKNLPSSDQDRAADPYLVAFCCGRSAAPAGKLAAMMGRQLPAKLKIIEVPCAGSVSREFILEAFTRGADGVMVLTCHTGNCHSERGNRHAQARAAEIQALLPLVGIEKERLVTGTFASTMGAEFARFVGDFADNISKLGSSNGRSVRQETA